MSVSLNVTAYSSKESKEFQKHYNAVKFCIENELSFPKETSEFFKGKIGGDNLEDVKSEAIIKYIENGVSMPIPLEYSDNQSKIYIRVKDIPVGCDLILVSLS